MLNCGDSFGKQSEALARLKYPLGFTMPGKRSQFITCCAEGDDQTLEVARLNPVSQFGLLQIVCFTSVETFGKFHKQMIR
jgi:hypothetical protein